MDIVSIFSSKLAHSVNYIDLNLVLFYTLLTILFSILLTFERSKRYINKLKIIKTKATQVAVRSSSKTALTTKKTLYSVYLKTHRVRRIGGKLVKNIIRPLSSNRTLNDVQQRNDFDSSTIISSSTTTTTSTLSKLSSTMKRSSSYLLTRTNRLGMKILDRRSKLRTSQKVYNSKVRLYKKLPLRSMSRLWGIMNSIDLPVWLRKPVYVTYSWLFGCQLQEMDIEDLNHYKNLSQFFRRKLKSDARVIDQEATLVSPCDGKVLYFGKADKGYLEQVKGVNYSLKGFLGDQNWNDKNQVLQDDLSYQNTLKCNSDNELYHCIIYLAPGDYHRFHSPTEWDISYRRHFPGELFSVNPSVARWLQGLFSLNERVVYYGNWQYGFFSMTPVGATNVGSIRVYFDSTLETNLKSKELNDVKLEKDFRLEKSDESGIKNIRGDYFGEFNLGSTIVLVFEAPKNFNFTIKQNQKVKVGQPIGLLVD